ncbi:MAG: DISARM anti-phage system protein DrmE domain-containing protein [Candidatus Helarchaeota archaeon]
MSPLTNLTLNLLTSSPIDSNFIICIPSITLRPIPLISYILADRTKYSVLVFSKNNHHHNNYYLLKILYGSKFAYMDFPVAKIRNKDLIIEPYTPNATYAFKKEIKKKIPYLYQIFLNEEKPKIIFYQHKDPKLISTIDNIRYFNDPINNTYSQIDLNIKNIIFENIDFIVYNKIRYDNFIKWITICMDRNYHYIFHISNPDYKLLNILKQEFNAKVLYFPYSFLRANENLRVKNLEYYDKIIESKHFEAISRINLDDYRMYQKSRENSIQIQITLIKGNIDLYFIKGLNLFKKIQWGFISKDLSPIIFKLKHLFFSIYKIFTIPTDFYIRYLDHEFGWRFYNLRRFLKNALRTIETLCISPNLEILTDIILYLFKMINELTECKRYGESLSYSRVGKYYALFDFLNQNKSKKIVIGVQTGEKNSIIEKLEKYDFNGDIRVYTFKQLAPMIGDFSDYILLLPGPLLPNHIQILFKNWKKVFFFVYNGNNKKWVEDQIDLIEKIDITKEELSILYLAEAYKNLEGINNYSVKNDALFKNFLKKKRILLESEGTQSQTKMGNDIDQLLTTETKFKSVSIIDLCRKLMKDDKKYTEILIEEKTKSFVQKKKKQYAEKFFQNTENVDCFAILRSELNKDLITIPLDYKKKYMFFKKKEDIKVKIAFPHAIPKCAYLVLFGKDEKLSISEFLKKAYNFEDNIDYNLIDEWQGRLASFFVRNYSTYKDFFRDFNRNYPDSISYNEFKEWVKGNINYTQDPKHLYKLGELMNDSFFINNYNIIHQEGRKIQTFNLKLSRKIKKLIVQVLNQNILWNSCSQEERLLIEKIENCIFKIENIIIKNK